MGQGTRLASFAAGLNWNDAPPPLRTKVLDHVVDTVGVMFAGIDMPSCAGARRAAAEWGRADDATVVGTAERAPAAGAAFLNALHGRIHTYDDTYEPGTMHPGSPVIAAALALAERHAADGPRFLCAVLAGYEVAARVAAAVSPGHYAAGFHNTGTCTVFGAAAAAARLLGLDGPACAETLGLAGATAGGLRQHQIDGSMLDSAFHGARAAQSGVMVAQMRACGVGGPPAILEGPLGFCAVMAPSRDLSRLDADLGERYEFAQMTVKPYATCRFAQGPTEAALELRRNHCIDPAQIEDVEIATFRQSIEVSDRPALASAFDATVSHQYSVALALVRGAVPLDAIRRPETAGEQVHDVRRRVRVVHDAELEREFPRCWPHRVTITMRDGRRFAARSDYPPGRTSPVPSATVDAKFAENAAPYLGDAGARRALEALRALEACGDVGRVARLLAAAT
ncbi:MmgE/PrpD family protein [Pigmentiphaga soli]|uniref:MmgE/PrpD family protein n=1 Tax=Pigmentiphaga soli TaxID=1007095 RepID=A0ABP8HMT5_9BURK